MVEVLLVMFLPMVIFGVFALAAMWLGAESRPWFDERPVLDERPNWWPIRRSVPRDEDDEDEPPDGTPAPVPAPVRGQPRPVVAAKAAISPLGV